MSAWQRAGDWGLLRIAAPLVGAASGQLTVEESAALLVETFPSAAAGRELRIIVHTEERGMVEAIVRRAQA